jgi:hypothetical protein
LKLRTISLFLFSFLILSAGSWASDSQRKGFILGGGLGAGGMTDTSSYSGEGWTWHSFATAVNIKAGYAPTKSLELYLIGSGFVIGGQSWEFIGVAGVGLTKYLSRNGTGLYFSGGLGISFFNWEHPIRDPSMGFLFSAGYNLSKHLSLQCDIIHARLSMHTEMFRNWEDAWGFGVTLNYLVF